MQKKLLLALLIIGCVFAQDQKHSLFDGISISLGFNSSQIRGNLEDTIFLEGQDEKYKVGLIYGWQKKTKE